MRQLVKTFKALSDETRLRILKLLEERELCVCEIMQALDMEQSRISRHLGILRDADLVTDRRDKLWVLYSLNRQAREGYAGHILDLLKDWGNDNPMVLADRERLKTVTRGPRYVS